MISLLECAAQAALYASHAADIAFLVRPQEETDSAAKRASRAYRSVNKDRPSGPAERCSTAKKQEGAEAFLAAAEAIKAAANGIQGLEGSNVNEVYVRIRKVNEWVVLSLFPKCC